MKTTRTVIAASVVLALSPATVAHAAKYWKNGVVNGSWNTGNNWSVVSAAGADNGGVPVGGEAVNIVHTDGVARTVALDVSTPSLGLVSLDLTGPGSAANTLSITSNNSITAAALSVGGYNGTAFTNGRGAVNQSAGTTTISPGVDLIMAWGSGSTGTYTLNGGAIVANQGVWVGYAGIGRFNHSAGTHTINASAFGGFFVGANADALGVYNLSGAGALTANANEYVGYSGVGIFNQTGGANTVTGAGGLTLGWAAGSNGSYMISSGALTANSKIEVGRLGIGTLTIQNNGSVFTDNLTINNQSTVNLNGGTLRFNTVGGTGGLNPSNFHFNAGTIQLAGNRTLGADSTIATLFGGFPTISSGKGLTVEGNTTVSTNVSVDGGKLTALGSIFDYSFNVIGGSLAISNGGVVNASSTTTAIGSATNGNHPPGSATVSGAGSTLSVGYLWGGKASAGTLQITAGGTVTSEYAEIGGLNSGATFNASVSGTNSKWVSGHFNVGSSSDFAAGVANLSILDNALVSVGGNLGINPSFGNVVLNGGTLRFATVSGLNRLTYSAGTIQLAGNRNFSTDSVITTLYGASPTIPTGKGVTVEGTATLDALSPVTLAGGTMIVGTMAMLPGSSLVTSQSSQVIGPVAALPGSVIDASGGNLVVGDANKVNGFYGNGTLRVGERMVTIADANDAVFDSAALLVLGSDANPGTLNAANGLTLDFGGNITGFGTVSTPNSIAKPLINNGHITGNSLAQRITLPGYVKGAGTFDNVNITGTFSPGLSPTILSVGNVAFSPTSTLIMELGGTAPGSGYDQIHSSGTLTFDGALQISLINGFSPSPGQSFNLFDSATTNGAFDTLQLPLLTGFTWNTSQLATGMLSVAIPGDFNSNGTVDAADYVVWRKGLGTTYTQANYNEWRTHFGQTAGGGSSTVANAAVPEPSTLVMLVLAAAGSCSRRSRAT